MIGIFLDSESNGLDPQQHRLLEIAFAFVDILTGKELCSFESKIYQNSEVWAKSDPQSLYVNGVSYEMIKDAPSEEIVAEEIRKLFSQFSITRNSAIFICQNPSFDRAFFSQLIRPAEQEKRRLPYHWLDLASMFWAIQLKNGKLPWESGVSKDKIASYLHLDREKLPHRAMNGVRHLIECYKALIGFPRHPLNENPF